MAWQPIETAPKNGTWLLLTAVGDWKAHIGLWDEMERRWVKDGEGRPLSDLTHWMPLPAPPQEDRES